MFYGKTKQYRQFVADMRKAGYTGKIDLIGSVKLHGTNAGIKLDIENMEITPFSRNRVLTSERGDEHYGFREWAKESHLIWLDLMMNYAALGHTEVILYGEWAGPGVQKGVAISQAPKKAFYVFKEVIDGEERNLRDKSLITTLEEFYPYEITIDLDNPAEATAELERLTLEVEKECPIAKKLWNVSGVGEGIVWKHPETGMRFKVKGEKHSTSKVKKLVTVDPEKVASIKGFVEYTVTENRLNQGLEHIDELSHKNIGKFIGWVSKDIHDEESDTLEANGLTMKDVGSQIANKARSFIMEKLNEV